MSRKIIWIAVILCLSAFNAMAFPVSPDTRSSQVVRMGVDSNAFLNYRIGYSYAFGGLTEFGTRILLGGNFSFPVFLAVSSGEFETFSFSFDAAAEILRLGDFSLMTDTQFFITFQDDVLGTFVPLGLSFSVMPALRFSRWYIGMNAEVNLPLLVHIRHSDYVKQTFVDSGSEGGPVDGWYSMTSVSFKTGIASSVLLGRQMEIISELGCVWYPSPLSGIFDSMMIGQIPFYLILETAYRW